MKLLIFKLYSVTALILSSQLVFGLDSDIGEKSGYVRNTDGERYVRTYELSELPILQEENLEINKKIFSIKLIGEFDRKYKETFGENETEQRFNTPTQYTDFVYSNGTVVSQEEDFERQNVYGEFVVKRLTEHQVDTFFNTNPSLRRIVEIKEKLSNVSLSVKKGYKVNLNYSLSSNALDVKVKNPYDIQMRLSLKMNPDNFGPSKVLNEILYLGYSFENRTSLNANYDLRSSSINISANKGLSKTLSASVTAISQVDSFDYDKLVQDEDVGSGPEKKLIFGVSYRL